ncbi:MAG: helix-turn-helix transcriptional regulator [Leptolyngbyaceae cyanobacterium CSU_1_4]|nr:helix-turn-helix transcriptional regulator [Leptolyngbyaceae cyanobacterium CSU_1_4]
MSLESIQQINIPVPNTHCLDEFESIWVYPDELGQGYSQDIQLQEWLELSIAQYHLHQDTTTAFPEHRHPIQAGFCLSGHFKYRGDAVSRGKCWFCGSGLAPGGTEKSSAQSPITMINVHIEPEQFRQAIANSTRDIPPLLHHLFRSDEQVYYVRFSQITTAIQSVLQQILHCPYYGITKRMYLESKALELLALSVEQELVIQTDDRRDDGRRDRGEDRLVLLLKPDDIDRVHYARELLQQRLDNPPSLIELARSVGLNDCTLKRGFRQVFGTTVFGHLHNYRLEQAQQLLTYGEMKVEEVAHTVGYGDVSAFGRAFRRKFSMSPRDYKLAVRSRL